MSKYIVKGYVYVEKHLHFEMERVYICLYI